MAEKVKKYAHKGKPHLNWRQKRKKRLSAKPEKTRGRRGFRSKQRR